MRYGQFKLSEDEIQSLRPVVGNQKDAGDYVDIIQDKAEEKIEKLENKKELETYLKNSKQ